MSASDDTALNAVAQEAPTAPLSQAAGCQRGVAVSAAISAQLRAEAGRQRSQAISAEMDAQVAGCQRNLTISAAISAQLGEAISAEIDAAAGSQRSLAISVQLDAERGKQLDEASEAPATRPPRPLRPHWQSMVRCFALRSGAGESA